MAAQQLPEEMMGRDGLNRRHQDFQVLGWLELSDIIRKNFRLLAELPSVFVPMGPDSIRWFWHNSDTADSFDDVIRTQQRS
jgi:hypothetical protein